MDNANNAVRSETLPLTIAGNTIFSGGTPTMKAIPFTKCYKLISPILISGKLTAILISDERPAKHKIPYPSSN